MEFKSGRKNKRKLHHLQANNILRTKPVGHKLPIPGDFRDMEKAPVLVRAELG